MDQLGLDFLTNQVAVELNMFRSFMKGGVVCDMNGREIVTVYRSWLSSGNLQVIKQVCEPLNLTRCYCKCSMFSLIRGSRDSLLLLRPLTNQRTTKIYAETSDQAMGVQVTYPISITKHLELKVRLGRKE